jgi:hypothetical protein
MAGRKQKHWREQGLQKARPAVTGVALVVKPVEEAVARMQG